MRVRPRLVVPATVVALAAGGSLLWPAVTATAQTPGAPGLLAVLRTGSPSGLVTMQPDGSAAQLVWPDVDARNPSFSPDGSQIALVDAGPDGGRHAYVASATGEGRRQVTPDTQRVFDVAWSPDGQQLVYLTGTDDLYVIAAGADAQAAPAEPRLLLDTDCINDVTWGVDDAVYFTWCEQTIDHPDDVHRLPSAGGTATVVADTPEAEVWVDVDPTGTRIATATGETGSSIGEPGRLWLMSADGSARTQVDPDRQATRYPVFSPDGTQLAFVGSDPAAADQAHVYEMELAPDLTASGQAHLLPADPDPAQTAYGLAWQPVQREHLHGAPSAPSSSPAPATSPPPARPTSEAAPTTAPPRPADLTGPTISIASPVDGATFTAGQPVTATWTCDDPSGVARCTARVGTAAVTAGAALPTATPGTYTLTVDAADNAANPASASATYTVVPAPGDASATATPGQTVSTGATATADVPVQTSVKVPAGVSGPLTIDAQPTTAATPAGFGLFGQQVVLEGPVATASAPYTVAFTVDASALGGIAPADVQVWRNGTAVTGCTSPTAAVPDPCIVSRGFGADGDAVVTVRTSHFSTWTLGKPVYALTGPLAPVDARPTVNTAKAGSAIPVRFRLGGDRGLDVLAAGWPKVVAASCGSATDEIETTVSASSSRLVYESLTKSYVYIWKTDRSMVGCRELVLRFRDGTELRSLYRLR